MCKKGLGGIVAALVLVSSQLAWADHPQVREGFWIGFGGGYGSAKGRCDGCDGGGREGSFTGFVKLGGTLNKHVLLGVETNAWIKSQDQVTLTLGNVAGTVTFYPQATAGFFLKGGVGVSYLSTDVQEGSVTTSVNKAGWGVLAGLGYDVRVGRNISITPCVNYFYGQPGDVVVQGETALAGWKQDVIDFGIGITFH
jgi:hypothetical protein